MSQTPAVPSAQNNELKPHVFAGRVPNMANVYGLKYPGKARVCLSDIREYLIAHPERLAELFCLEDDLPNGKTAVRFVIAYRAFDTRFPDQWRPTAYELTPTANLFEDVTYGWAQAEGIAKRENTYLLKLLREEAERRPEAANALRSILLSDVSELPTKAKLEFMPL